jgi:TP901 family phage tail tape measure protein
MGFIFSAQDQASAQIRMVNSGIAGLARESTATASVMKAAALGLGGALATMAAGAGTITGLFALANQAGNFERSLAGVGAVTKATSEEMVVLRRAAIDAGIATQFSPDQAVEGLLSLATAGQTAKQATETLLPTLGLAAASLGELGMAESAAAIVGTLNSYGMSATEAGNVTDRLLRITQLTNFATKDFETGLAKAAAAGATFGTELDDVLITVGLLRNRNIDASSSATAFREAVRRLASDQGAQAAVASAQVDIFDKQTGAMRNSVDIIMDLVDATTGMTDQRRNAIIVDALGARGMLAFNAIQQAQFTTMRDGREVTLSGRDAIAALREEMQRSTGVTEEFTGKLLETFKGQQTLLTGTLQTLGVVLGEPSARLFAPFVEALTQTLNVAIRVFDAIPKPVQTAMMGIVGAVGLAMVAFGGMTAAALTITLLIPVLEVLGTVLLGLAAGALPVIAAAGALGVAIGALAVAVRRNIGGLGDMLQRFKDNAFMAFDALSQLFSSGRISGPLVAELTKAENEGLLQFISNVYAIGFRIQRFFEGLTSGFGAFMDQNAYTINLLVVAFFELGRALGFAGDSMEAFAGAPSADANARGIALGETIGKLALVLVEGVTWIARLGTTLVEMARIFWDVAEPGVSLFLDSLDRLFVQLGIGFGTSNDKVSGFTAAMNLLVKAGIVLAAVLGGVVSALGWMAHATTVVLTAITLMINKVKEFFDLPVVKLLTWTTLAPARLAGLAYDALGEREPGAGITKTRRQPMPFSSEPFPAGAEASGRRESMESSLAGLNHALAAMQSRPTGPENINLQASFSVDGDVLAETMSRVGRGRDASSFQRRVSIGEE